jgi:hypothetical protein
MTIGQVSDEEDHEKPWARHTLPSHKCNSGDNHSSDFQEQLIPLRFEYAHHVHTEQILGRRVCTGLCVGAYTGDCSKGFIYPALRKADLRISIKDDRRNRSLKVTLVRVPFGQRQFLVRMDGKPWPASGRPVSVTRVMTALRKALAQAV